MIIKYALICSTQICLLSSPNIVASSPPGRGQKRALSLSSLKCPRHAATDQLKKEQSIIQLWPRVSWCQQHISTPLNMLKYGVCSGQSMMSTEVQQPNTNLVRVRRAILPNHAPPGLTVIAQVSVEVL